jgi:hypothetical protein
MEKELFIICTHSFRGKITTHPKFEIDLGRRYTLKSDTGVKVDILDPFVLNFYKNENTLIYKVGRMGIINFYTFNDMPDEEVWLYRNLEKYVREYNPAELAMNPEKYLAKLIWSLDDEPEKTID